MARRTNSEKRKSIGKPCYYCKRRLIEHKEGLDIYHRGLVITDEHIMPRVFGGDNDRENILYSCARCNNLRGHVDFTVFLEFARVIIQRFPDMESIVLRKALNDFVLNLAALGIKHRKEKQQILSLLLLDVNSKDK